MGRNLHADVEKDEAEFVEPANLRLLRRMVTGLMAVLGLGMIIITGTIVWKLNETRTAPAANLPAMIISADGINIAADDTILALGGDGANILVLVREQDGNESIRTYSKGTGELLSSTSVSRSK